MLLIFGIPANYGGGDMSRRQPNYGPGPAPGFQYQMQGPGYQAMQYGPAGYVDQGADMYNVNSASYPTPV